MFSKFSGILQSKKRPRARHPGMELSGALQGYAFADRPRLRPTDRAGNARNFEKSLAQHKNTAPAKNPAGSPKKSGSRRGFMLTKGPRLWYNKTLY